MFVLESVNVVRSSSFRSQPKKTIEKVQEQSRKKNRSGQESNPQLRVDGEILTIRLPKPLKNRHRRNFLIKTQQTYQRQKETFQTPSKTRQSDSLPEIAHTFTRRKINRK